MEIIAFDTNPEVVRALRESIGLPYFSTVLGNGIDATRAANLDALWMTWMQAERFGATPLLEPHKASVFPTREEDTQRGFPPFIVAGVMLGPSDARDPAYQLELVVRSMLQAVEDFYVTTGTRILRIGTIPENLLLTELSPEQATLIIAAAFADAGIRHK
jgi:hypothetical protein